MSSHEKCVNDIKTHCKKNYILGGPITSEKGRKKCKEDLRDAGVWGRDRRQTCKNDPEQCDHQRCYDLDETYPGGYKNAILEAEPYLKTNMGLLKTSMMGQTSKMMGQTAGKSRKMKKSRKVRKSRKMKKSRKSKKSRKTKKAKKSRKSKK